MKPGIAIFAIFLLAAIAKTNVIIEHANPLRIPFVPKVNVEKAERKKSMPIQGFSPINFFIANNINPKYPISTIKNHPLTVIPEALHAIIIL